jgi:hypothetical protein
MDIGGVLILLASLVLFILAFTQAPVTREARRIKTPPMSIRLIFSQPGRDWATASVLGSTYQAKAVKGATTMVVARKPSRLRST